MKTVQIILEAKVSEKVAKRIVKKGIPLNFLFICLFLTQNIKVIGRIILWIVKDGSKMLIVMVRFSGNNTRRKMEVRSPFL